MEPWLQQVRGDTPGVDDVVHLDNAGCALPTQVVLDTVIAHLQREAHFGGYAAAAEAHDRLAAVYRSIADLIGARPHEIAVVENATRAWDMAVYGFPFQRGDRVLTGRAEYASNVIGLLQLQRRHGIELVVVPDDGDGQISLDALDRELQLGAAMVALTHVPTFGGLVNPAAAVGGLCRRHGVCFVLDACQSIGQIPIDVETIGCDVLAATGRKFLRAPRGTGFLYVREEWIERLEPPLLDLHAATWTGPDTYVIRSDARRFENWEAYYAGKLGLGAAVDYALALDLHQTWARIQRLAARLRTDLAQLPGVHCHDRGAQLSGIVTFTCDRHESADVHRHLAESGINASVSAPQYAQLDQRIRALPPMVRSSVHYYNVDGELDRLVAAMAPFATSS